MLSPEGVVWKELSLHLSNLATRTLKGAIPKSPTWLQPVLDIAVNFLTGKNWLSWLEAGIGELLAGLNALYNSDSWLDRLTSMRNDATFQTVASRAADIVAKEPAYRTATMFYDIVQAPIPEDLPIMEWAKELAKRYPSMTPLQIVDMRASAITTG